MEYNKYYVKAYINMYLVYIHRFVPLGNTVNAAMALIDGYTPYVNRCITKKMDQTQIVNALKYTARSIYERDTRAMFHDADLRTFEYALSDECINDRVNECLKTHPNASSALLNAVRKAARLEFGLMSRWKHLYHAHIKYPLDGKAREYFRDVGGRYNMYGFNIHGIHRDTGTKYDPHGYRCVYDHDSQPVLVHDEAGMTHLFAPPLISDFLM